MSAKIISLEEWRPRNDRVVLAHGCFDLLHLGHMKYLEAAKREGDYLLVSVTADKFVNKGPHRPAFPEQLRAEALAHLACVDGVIINHAPTAVPVIRKVRPAIYAKGGDYANGGGEIEAEKSAVASVGGRTIFTDEITFSSSALINRHIETDNAALRDYFATARAKNYAECIPKLIESISGMKVLMVGEMIIDTYIVTSALGKPPKESVLAVLEQSAEEFSGGVMAAASHIRSFVKQVDILTNDPPHIRKTRFLDGDFGRKLFETYSSIECAADEEIFQRAIIEKASAADVVAVFDFGHGLLTPKSRRLLMQHSRFLAVNTQSNSANHGFNLITQYPKANYYCLDAPEARLAVRDKNAPLERIAEKDLHEWIDPQRLIITHGKQGCVAWDRHHAAVRIPAFSNRVVDTMGAGDAFLAVTAPLAKVSDDMEIVGFIGNAVGAMKVGTFGHRQPIEKSTLMGYITSLLK